MTKDEQVKRMHGVERIMGDPLFVEAFDSLRNHFRDAMETAKSDEATLKAKQYLQLLNDLHQHWQRVMKDGSLALAEIKLDEERKKVRWPKWA